LEFLKVGVAVRKRTQALLRLLTIATTHMPEDVTWSTAALEGSGRLVVRGTVSDYARLFQMIAALSAVAGVEEARLQSATEREKGQVEFELVVQGVVP